MADAGTRTAADQHHQRLGARPDDLGRDLGGHVELAVLRLGSAEHARQRGSRLGAQGGEAGGLGGQQRDTEAAQLGGDVVLGQGARATGQGQRLVPGHHPDIHAARQLLADQPVHLVVGGQHGVAGPVDHGRDDGRGGQTDVGAGAVEVPAEGGGRG